MNFLLESRNDNKHRFFLNFGTASINGYILKNIALELITLILMCTFIMNINQISAFFQFFNLKKSVKISEITPKQPIDSVSLLQVTA